MIGVQTIGSVSVIKARNSLVGDCLAQCQRSVDECLSNRRPLIILDLGDSPIINSEGLEFITTSQQRCIARGGKLVVAQPQALCAEVLHITGVEDSVAVFADLRAALSEFAK